MANVEKFIMSFVDGTAIPVEPDGCGNWLSDAVTPEILTDQNLHHVMVTLNGDPYMTYTDVVCDGIYAYLKTHGFCLREKTPEEKYEAEVEALQDALIELAELVIGG